jgi:hypothetical protein
MRTRTDLRVRTGLGALLRTDHRVRTGLGALLSLAMAGTALAQIPNASPAATGLGGAYTARARGYDAVAWNPANLGMPGNPGFSIGILAIHGSSGLDPISLSDFADYSNKALPASQRETWLQTVTSKGGEKGRLDGGITYVGFNAGAFAFQVATSVGGSSTLKPDAVEALFFGNAGRTGTLKNLNLQGSRFRAGVFTSAGLSYGLSLDELKPVSHMAIGATLKYVAGNAIAMAEDQGTTTTSDAVSVNFPVVYSRPDSNTTVGSGIGLDVGFAWSKDKLSFGATVQNVFNTFAWDEGKLLAKNGTAVFNGTTNTTDFTDRPYASVPASLRGLVTDDKFKPVVGVGIAYAWTPDATLSADARQQIGDGITLGPKTQVAGGLEFRGIPILRLRAGASYVTDGWGVSGGVGLALGSYELGVGAALRTVNGGKEPVFTLNLLSIR